MATLGGEKARRTEYAARIHRVVDHIEGNLGRELTLAELARVACFSPFHFHRLFTAMTGESLHRFILRLRLERAASQLLHNPGKSITEIALDCGFGGSATFARAFRAAFGASASEWRSAGSKERKAMRKTCKDAQGGPEYGPVDGADPGAGDSDPWGIAMKETREMKEAQSVRVETLEPMTVAYLRHVGPYAGDAALFGRLFGQLMTWAGPRGLIRGRATKMLSVYHDDPEITDEQKLRMSVCITVPPGTPVGGEVGLMELPRGEYALAHFELDPGEYGAAWNWVFGKWLPGSGYQPDDRPCFEIYLGDPMQHPQKKHVVDICVPVKPM